MTSISAAWLYKDRGLRGSVAADGYITRNPCFNQLQTSFFGSRTFQVRVGSIDSSKRACKLPSIKCEKKDDENFKQVSVERPPYYSYMDSTSGQLEPASGAHASIPEKEYWPKGIACWVRAAQAPEPTGNSLRSPSYGKNPGSRRRKQSTSVAAPKSSEVSVESSELVVSETSEDAMEDPKYNSSEYVVYQTKPEQEEETRFNLDKKLGRPRPFLDPKAKKPIEEPLTSDELWWNWRKPDKEQRSRWQRRRSV